jgi:hypothetical protein
MAETSTTGKWDKALFVQVILAIALVIGAFKTGEGYGAANARCQDSKTRLLELNILYNNAIDAEGVASPLAHHIQEDIIEVTARLKSVCPNEYRDVEGTLEQRFHL